MNDLEEKKELTLSSSTEELEQRIMETDDPEELQKIINLFNINIKKKDIIRAGKLNKLQDKTLAQITERIEKNPDLFSNRDLLDYYKVIQDTLTRADISTDNMPKIQFNQQIINVNQEDSLSRESKEKVMDLIKAIMQQPLIQEAEVVDADVKGDNNENGDEERS